MARTRSAPASITAWVKSRQVAAVLAGEDLGLTRDVLCSLAFCAAVEGNDYDVGLLFGRGHKLFRGVDVVDVWDDGVVAKPTKATFTPLTLRYAVENRCLSLPAYLMSSVSSVFLVLSRP